MAIRIYKKSEKAQLGMLLELMREAADHPVRRAWFTHSNTAYKYFQGEMWTPEELQVLQDRMQSPVVINMIQSDYERFEGQYKRQKLAMAFAGRNAPMDDDLASGLSDIQLIGHISAVLRHQRRSAAAAVHPASTAK